MTKRELFLKGSTIGEGSEKLVRKENFEFSEIYELHSGLRKNMKYFLYVSLLLFSSMLNAQSKPGVLGGGSSSSCTASSVSSKSKNTSMPALITSDGQAYSKDCFKWFLYDLVDSLDTPLVLFVHGRGEHPSKTFKRKNRLLQSIEEQYGVKVVMLTWASWCGRLCLPKKDAAKASEDLLDVIRLLDAIKAKTQTKQNFSLLTHSMGAFVLKGLVPIPRDDLSSDVFSSVLISASATPSKGHREWVDALKFSNTTYVLTNKQDRTLKCLERFHCLGLFNQPKLLGRWGNLGGDKAQHNTAIKYVNFTGLIEKTHRYYIGQRSKSPKVFDFFNATLRGLDPGDLNW